MIFHLARKRDPACVFFCLLYSINPQSRSTHSGLRIPPAPSRGTGSATATKVRDGEGETTPSRTGHASVADTLPSPCPASLTRRNKPLSGSGGDLKSFLLEGISGRGLRKPPEGSSLYAETLNLIRFFILVYIANCCRCISYHVINTVVKSGVAKN